MLNINNKQINGEIVKLFILKKIKDIKLQNKKKNKRVIKIYFFNFIIHFKILLIKQCFNKS